MHPQDIPGDESYAINEVVQHEIVPASLLKLAVHRQCKIPGCLGDALWISIRKHEGYTICVKQGYQKNGRSHKQCISMHIESKILSNSYYITHIASLCWHACRHIITRINIVQFMKMPAVRNRMGCMPAQIQHKGKRCLASSVIILKYIHNAQYESR